jgi:MFS family permease
MSAPTVDRTERRRSETYASLRIPEYRRLFVIGVYGFLATQSQVIARGWLANDLSDSNTGLGGVFMAFGIPMLIATPLGGVAADRYSRRLMMIVTFAMLMSSSMWIGLGVTFDFIEYWMLLATSAIQAVAFSFMVPSRMALTGEVVGRELIPNAIILGQMSMNATRVIGPAIAGIFIGISWIGVSGVYYVAAALSFVSLIGCVRLPAGRPPPSDGERSMRREFADGVNYVWQQRHVGLLLIASFVVVMIGFPYMAFMPRFATDVLDVGSTSYGALAAVSAVGAVVLSMAIAGRAKGRAAWRIQVVSGFAFGASLIAFAISPNFVTALITIAAVGAASSGFTAMNNSLALALSDIEYHGRVQSLMMLSFSGFGMAALPIGILADQIGLRETIASMGVVIVIAMALYQVASGRARRRFGDAALM